MESKVYEIIKKNSHPTFQLDKAVRIYELYSSKEKTATELSWEYRISTTAIYNIIHKVQTKVTRAHRQLRKLSMGEVKSIDKN